MTNSDKARTRFSTEGMFADLPPDRAGRVWRDFCAEHLGQLDIELREDVPFHGAIDGLTLSAEVSINRTALNARRIARTAAAIRADQNNRSVLVIHNTGAPALIRQRGREVSPAVGTALLYSHAHPAEFFNLPPTPCLQIDMDPRLLSSRVANPEDLLAVEARADPDTLRLLANYTRLLLDNELNLSDGLAAAAATHLVDLVSLVLGTGRDSAMHSQGRGVRAARLAAMKADILAHLRKEGLSVHDIARRHKVTPRYVQMLFDADGMTFSEFVVEQRLVRAHRMLAGTEFLGWTISAIAFEVGFSNLSYFNRTFLRRYGATPSDIRNAALPGR